MRSPLCVWITGCSLGCAVGFSVGCSPGPSTNTHTHEAPPAQPFDAIVVLGCPSEDDGSLSLCQMGRAGQAAIAWRNGHARSFIVTGGAVHTPYVEAEAIAEAMEAMGVPGDRIVLERNALHTDENVYYASEIAKARGLERVAIASTPAHASWACTMMIARGRACDALPMNIAALEAFMPPYRAALSRLRARRVADWVPCDEREEREFQESGYDRPPSFILYPMLSWRLADWAPYTSHPLPPITWRERRAQLGVPRSP